VNAGVQSRDAAEPGATPAHADRRALTEFTYLSIGHANALNRFTVMTTRDRILFTSMTGPHFHRGPVDLPLQTS
jgi:hypothetical protein